MTGEDEKEKTRSGDLGTKREEVGQGVEGVRETYKEVTQTPETTEVFPFIPYT